MDNVIDITGKDHMIESIETVLEHVKSGNIESIALVSVFTDGTYMTAINHQSRFRLTPLVGGLEILKEKVMKIYRDDPNETPIKQ